MPISTQEIKKILIELIENTQNLASSGQPENSSEFLTILLGIYRISFSTIRDIYYLSENKDTGGSILVLSRKIAEHAITVEYMIAKGKDKMTKLFKDHIWVQVNKEQEFFKLIGEDIAANNMEIKIGSDKAKAEYDKLSNDLKKTKTWAGKSIDQMLESLYKRKKLTDFDFTRISEAYVWGSWLNHPNPFVTRSYLNKEDNNDEYYYRQGLFMAITFHLRLTTRYIDEIILSEEDNKHKELSNRIKSIYARLNEK